MTSPQFDSRVPHLAPAAKCQPQQKNPNRLTGTADAIKTALSTLQTMHETEMVRAEMAGDNVEILRLKYRQLSEELEGQKAVVAATRAEAEKLPQPEFRKVRRRRT